MEEFLFIQMCLEFCSLCCSISWNPSLVAVATQSADKTCEVFLFLVRNCVPVRRNQQHCGILVQDPVNSYW